MFTSNFSYDDFAVLVRNFRQDMLESDSLRIVPLNGTVSMADAIKGAADLTVLERQLMKTQCPTSPLCLR